MEPQRSEIKLKIGQWAKVQASNITYIITYIYV